MPKSEKTKEGERRRKARWAEKNREKHLEGIRRRDKRWKENNPEHAAELGRKRSMKHYLKNHEEAKAKMRKRAKERWASMSVDERRDLKLRQAYGVSLQEWSALLEEQGGKCAVCKTSEAGKRGWQTDHCHTSGNVRGILCIGCNTALGLVKENIDTLQALVEYLRR